MNGSTDQGWSASDSYDPMTGVSEQDFASFLDLDNIDLSFPMLEDGGANQPGDDQQLKDLTDSFEMQHLPKQSEIGEYQEQPALHGQSQTGSHEMSQTGDLQETGEHNYMDFNQASGYAQDHSLQQQYDAQSQQGHGFLQSFRPVPPTPNSVEMHGDASRYMRQIDMHNQAMLEQQYAMRKGDLASLTPLVSPAVTPHDARFQIPSEFTVPGAYLSPLTSPALEGQFSQHQYTHNGQQALDSTAPSPVDLGMDMLESADMAEPERKKTKKTASARSSGTSLKTSQSPITKPNRRKAKPSSVIRPKEVQERRENAPITQGRVGGGSQSYTGQSNSENDSVSPETLSDAFNPPPTPMGPPPRPSSKTTSPAIHARQDTGIAPSPNAQLGAPCPATPASIMRLPASPAGTSSGRLSSDIPGMPDAMLPALDAFELPPAAADDSRPSTSNGLHDDDVPTPRVNPRKTPKFGPMSSPSASIALSGKQSPSLSAMASPALTASPGASKQPDSRVGRNVKKRNSVSSTLVSPAIRPKISPSIKPLLPEGATADEQHALLLATKSNYQNILEGSKIPGMNYSESLTTNLTSKRTSHKIAEQGRRNRINIALQEMQVLLPPRPTGKGGKGQNSEKEEIDDGDMKSPAGVGNSKAATVEYAIDYIKQLRHESLEKDQIILNSARALSDNKKAMDKQSKDMEEMQEQLDEMKKKLGHDDQDVMKSNDDDA